MKKTYLFSTSSHPNTIHINSLDITYFQPSIHFDSYDYFILTSKQAVESLNRYKIKTLLPAFCISKLTALAYENIGGKVLGTAKGYGDTLGSLILEKEKKYLYLRAKVIASDSILKLKEEGYWIGESILYESSCSLSMKNNNFEDASSFIFTSPSSVKCFLKYNSFPINVQTIVIGVTTAKALPKNINYEIASETSIESCLTLINK